MPLITLSYRNNETVPYPPRRIAKGSASVPCRNRTLFRLPYLETNPRLHVIRSTTIPYVSHTLSTPPYREAKHVLPHSTARFHVVPLPSFVDTTVPRFENSHYLATPYLTLRYRSCTFLPCHIATVPYSPSTVPRRKKRDSVVFNISHRNRTLFAPLLYRGTHTRLDLPYLSYRAIAYNDGTLLHHRITRRKRVFQLHNVYRTTPYHKMLYYTILYHAMPYHTVPYLPCHPVA